MSVLHELAREQGFVLSRLYAPEPFIHYKRRLEDGTLHPLGAGLSYDVTSDKPWANAVFILVYPYAPLPEGSNLSGYYIASNEAYHAAGRLITELEKQGIRAERGDVPVRELAMRHGLGQALKNGLTLWGDFGSRVAVQTLVLALPESIPYDADEVSANKTLCRDCHACERACPCGAIDEAGFHYRLCLRGNMDGETLPDWVKEALQTLLGCERCQYACPHNARIPTKADELSAFDFETILSGQIKPALALVGKNQNKGGKLIAHSIILAARAGRVDLLPRIQAFMTDSRPLVADCASWANRLLTKK